MCIVELEMGFDISVCVCVFAEFEASYLFDKCLIDLHCIVVTLFFVPKCEALECNLQGLNLLNYLIGCN